MASASGEHRLGQSEAGGDRGGACGHAGPVEAVTREEEEGGRGRQGRRGDGGRRGRGRRRRGG